MDLLVETIGQYMNYINKNILHIQTADKYFSTKYFFKKQILTNLKSLNASIYKITEMELK